MARSYRHIARKEAKIKCLEMENQLIDNSSTFTIISVFRLQQN